MILLPSTLSLLFSGFIDHLALPSFPTRRSSDLLVLATLHTNDAPSSITRMVDMGVDPFLVASSVACVAAQRLAKKLCEDRKSTRLNSSHLVISYAVFCLKKKHYVTTDDAITDVR